MYHQIPSWIYFQLYPVGITPLVTYDWVSHPTIAFASDMAALIRLRQGVTYPRHDIQTGACAMHVSISLSLVLPISLSLSLYIYIYTNIYLYVYYVYIYIYRDISRERSIERYNINDVAVACNSSATMHDHTKLQVLSCFLSFLYVSQQP